MKTCPSCKQAFDPRDSGSSLPFCSDRCRLIDLGAWLNEEHRIPSETEDPLPGTPPDPAIQH